MDKSYLVGLELIFNSISAHAYWKDKQGTYRACNIKQAQSFGLNDCSEVIGKNDFDLQPNYAAEVQKNDQRVLESNQAIVCEEKGFINGENVAVLTEKIPLRNEEGEAIGVIGISMDIQELKDTQNQLKKALTVKSEFIANMSHDIRTPIAGLSGLLQDLILTAQDMQQNNASNSQELLDKLINTVNLNAGTSLSAVDELLQLCNEILKIARLDSTQTENSSIKIFDLRELIQREIKLIDTVATHKGLNISIDIDERVPSRIEGRQRYLASTLLNILSNAVKFTESGHVKINVSVVEAKENIEYSKDDKIKLRFVIEDSGIGIPQEKHAEIFDQFTMVTPSYTGKYNGYGLGLYTVKRQVEAMQGTIELTSEICKGSTFTLTLPFIVPVTELATQDNDCKYAV